ncbi:glycosyltransferase family 2 protein [bacterium]|nr:glycosyltransferase family 2 protein [bacterium]
MKRPTFSVILPTFNRARVLAAAIESVQAQSERDWELIIIDDGSTDITRRLVARYAQSDPRIRYIAQRNRGVAKARNNGIRAALGRYLAFVDSDDTLRPNHLSYRLETFLKFPELEFIYSGAIIKGSRFVPDRFDPTRVVSLDDKDVYLCGTFTVKTATAIKLGGFPDVRYSEDGDFMRNAQAAGVKMLRVAKKTYTYNRSSEDSICGEILKSTKSDYVARS